MSEARPARKGDLPLEPWRASPFALPNVYGIEHVEHVEGVDGVEEDEDVEDVEEIRRMYSF
ncbi:MAG: hypothetical protein J5800_06800, partial [Spirochaetales bacterium]|nr:hypothetical protein [Spirochaetales bacterium]